MTLQDLKSQLESKSYTSNSILIFLSKKPTILFDQYINAIAEQKNMNIQYIDSLDEVMKSDGQLFFDEETPDTALYVYKCQKLDYDNEQLFQKANVIICTNELTDKSKKLFQRFVYEFPTLEDWQIKDYAYSLLEGIEPEHIDQLLKRCNGDIFRIDQEIKRLALFAPSERESTLRQFIKDGIYSDLSNYTVFNFSNAIDKKDIETIVKIYKQIQYVDITDMFLYTVLWKNFRNIILTQLQPIVTENTTGLPSKQLYAVKKIPRVYSRNQLVRIYELLTSVDKKVKNGELPTEILVDYLTVKILSIGNDAA